MKPTGLEPPKGGKLDGQEHHDKEKTTTMTKTTDDVRQHGRSMVVS